MTPVGIMKNFDAQKFHVGQKLMYCAGTKIQTVTFVSMGPRIGKAAGKDTVTRPPQTAIVRDADDNLITVRLEHLRPLPPSDNR